MGTLKKLSDISFSPDLENCEKKNIETKQGTLVLRVPVCYDFWSMEEELKTESRGNTYDRVILFADRVALTINRKPCTLNDILSLDQEAVKALMSWTVEIYTQMMPDIDDELLQKLGLTANDNTS
jgi:hypothetical protein